MVTAAAFLAERKLCFFIFKNNGLWSNAGTAFGVFGRD
jgi:hypothetical protein